MVIGRIMFGMRIVHPDPSPERQRLLRTVGGHPQGRMPGLDTHPRPTTPGTCPSDLHRALQRGQAHRGLDLRTPTGRALPALSDLRAAGVRGRDVLGGIIHEYGVAA
jgi:hypothetical protein